MQILNLVIEFEMQRIKESQSVKDYTDRPFGITNSVRLLGSEFSYSRIVQKVLVTGPKRYEAIIISP